MVGNLAFNLKNLDYSEILKNNTALAQKAIGKDFRINLLSNIIINPIKELLEFSIRSMELNPIVRFGNYDNIVQDTFLFKDQFKSDLTIIFYELINLSENFHVESELLSEEDVTNVINKCKKDIDIIFSNLSNSKLILFNEFTSYPFTGINSVKRNINRIEIELNQYLVEIKPGNVHLIDIKRILSEIGILHACDRRKYNKYKTLYKIDFFKFYVVAIENIIFRNTGKLKKALILDCDNTLWKGIIGEDGYEGVNMSANNEIGKNFNLVQKIVANLSLKGVLICLCSKNNPEDVQNILLNHPDMVLNDDLIIAKKVNWDSKDINIRNLAHELNIGLDSLIFIDDSEFEINLIKNKIPEVLTITVPKDLTEYPLLLVEIAQRYFNLIPLKEDLNKLKSYKEQTLRESMKTEVGNIESYLQSLEIEVEVHKNIIEHIPRISQLSQKTNQFNLTTKRYSETEILNYFNDLETIIFTVEVSDKFGQSGLTGLAIITTSLMDKNDIIIDTFLLSCRILGRKIESAFIDYILTYFKTNNYEKIEAKYIKTAKNSQVKDFYEKHQFKSQRNFDNETIYSLDLKTYKETPISFIHLK